jgi:hypothetical protein
MWIEDGEICVSIHQPWRTRDISFTYGEKPATLMCFVMHPDFETWGGVADRKQCRFERHYVG